MKETNNNNALKGGENDYHSERDSVSCCLKCETEFYLFSKANVTQCFEVLKFWDKSLHPKVMGV